ncbi:MAG: DNA alkylation repair protein [Myxococcales bacterium]|nr:DNA alkylation repair protein [Myxococcales bacterium]
MLRCMADPLLDFVVSRLQAQADPERAPAMAAYMKTDMPFFGVAATPRRKVGRASVRAFAPADRADYEAKVACLWGHTHRETKYVAVQFAAQKRFVDAASLPLYRRLVVEGAWWDFVDEIAAHLVGGALAEAPDVVFPVLDRWIEDDVMWLRRTAILAQLRMGERTDAARLFRYCRARMHETEFFVRKAIGWALRQYASVDPEAVRAFVEAEKGSLSGLSYREATKHL